MRIRLDCRDKAVTRVSDLHAVGIDVKTTEPFTPAATDHLCAGTDRAFRDAASLPPLLPWANLVLSAKEAMSKAHFPLYCTQLQPETVPIRAIADRSAALGSFQAVPLVGDAADQAFCIGAEGRWAVRNGHIYCAVVCT